MSKKITIRDVAEEAGVGIGTVSRVMNNSPHVSDETRERVMEVVRELGYRPSAIARQLPRKINFQTIGVITRPFMEYYSFAERLRGVHKALRPYENEYELTLYTTDSTRSYGERLREIIETSVISGLLVIDFNLTEEQKDMLRRMNIIFVGLNHYHAEDWPCIGTDNQTGGYRATRHLLELGHRRIAYVGNELIDAAGFPTSQQRYRGYVQALEEAGITPANAYRQTGAAGYEAAHAMTQTLLQLETPPTAIFAMSDTQALGCIQAIRRADLQVPDDLSVIGYDDLELSYHTGLSTVRQHLELSGEVAIQYLLHLLNDDTEASVPSLPPVEVVPRHTTAPLASPN
jgi:LacI family transcriptional regulator